MPHLASARIAPASTVSTRAVKTRNARPPLQCLFPDEAAFVDAAFQCILPEARAEGLEISASAYVDAKLARGVSYSSLRFYRSEIADVQALCESTLGRRFQALPIWQQLAVLAQIERPAGAARGVGRCLLDLLLTDAAEAYFEAVAPSCGTLPTPVPQPVPE